MKFAITGGSRFTAVAASLFLGMVGLTATPSLANQVIENNPGGGTGALGPCQGLQSTADVRNRNVGKCVE
jgi:hypothetical protein